MPEWKDVGIGGLLCLLVLREVFNFLKTRGMEKSRDQQDKDNRDSRAALREEIRVLLSQVMNDSLKSTLDQQIRATEAMRDQLKVTADGILKLITIYEVQRKNRD